MKAAKSEGEEAFALQLQARGIASGWVREYRYLPKRRFRADFAHPVRRILVEVEGGSWMRRGGRHNRGAGFEADCEKQNAAILAGWRIFRGTTEMAVDGRLAQVVEEAMRNGA